MAKFCQKCGTELNDNDVFCGNCGNNSNYNTQNNSDKKSKVTAGMLGIFLGYFGVHNFYLGYTGKAVAQLILTCVGWIFCGIGPIIASIWGIIEGIMIFTGSINTDAQGNTLVE